MKMVGFDDDLTIRREIDRVLHLHQAAVNVVMEFDNIETIKRAIEIDAGAGLLPEPTVLREVQSGTLVAVPLDTDELVRPLGIIHRRGKELSTVALRFIELLQRQARSSSAETTAVAIDLGNGHASGHAANGHPVMGHSAAGHSAAGHPVAGRTENGHAGSNNPSTANQSTANPSTANPSTAASIAAEERPENARPKLAGGNRRR